MFWYIGERFITIVSKISVYLLEKWRQNWEWFYKYQSHVTEATVQMEIVDDVNIAYLPC